MSLNDQFVVVTNESGGTPGTDTWWYSTITKFNGSAELSGFGLCSNEAGGCGAPASYQHVYGPEQPLTETWCRFCWQKS